MNKKVAVAMSASVTLDPTVAVSRSTFVAALPRPNELPTQLRLGLS